VTNSAWDGIYLYGCSNNTFVGNTVTNSAWDGISLSVFSSNNTFVGNMVTNNAENGISLYGCSNNTFVGNTVTNNTRNGISLYGSSNNTFYHNNFIGNTHQVYASSDSLDNMWDDGHPSGGNYWSDYEEKYPDADELDGSGIWNTQYDINANNTDNYPLMYQWPPLDTDGDGTPDVDDAFPLDGSESMDTDGDGVGNNADTDDDDDGMPDTWETDNELDPLNATDGSLDPDGDGLTNLQEYQGNTDPKVSDAQTFHLWVSGVAAAVVIGGAVVATFLWRRRKQP
jgi:parallel beta-helix repeat protein